MPYRNDEYDHLFYKAGGFFCLLLSLGFIYRGIVLNDLIYMSFSIPFFVGIYMMNLNIRYLGNKEVNKNE